MHAGRISASWSESLPHHLECQNHNKYLTSMYSEPFTRTHFHMDEKSIQEALLNLQTNLQQYQRRLFLICGTNGKYRWFLLSERQFYFTCLHSITSLWQIIFLPLMFPHYPAVIWWAFHWKLLEVIVMSPHFLCWLHGFPQTNKQINPCESCIKSYTFKNLFPCLIEETFSTEEKNKKKPRT